MKTDLNKISKNEPILVTGGGGYIGTHVVEQLLSAGYKVRVYDKFVFGREIIDDLAKHPNLELVEGDISDLFKLTQAFQGTQAVIHLAGLVGDPACALDEEFTVHMNVVSTKIVKELSKSFHAKRFIFSSSCSVYGVSDNIIDETGQLNPVSLYAKTKIDSEHELLGDQSQGFHPTVLRFATVFGHSRRPRFDLVVNLFTAQAFNEGLITVKGSDQWRPFIHVRDIAKAIVKTIESPLAIVDRQIFNVGDDRLNITIGDLAKLVAKVVIKDKNGKPVVVSVDDSSIDRRNYRVSFTKISQSLGFKAETTLEEGIKELHQQFIAGIYQGSYKDIKYVNVEMTKLLQTEFRSPEYRNNHISFIQK